MSTPGQFQPSRFLPAAYRATKLAWIAKTDPRLYRAYLLKEGLRHVFSVKGEEGKQALDRWIHHAEQREQRGPGQVGGLTRGPLRRLSGNNSGQGRPARAR